MLIHSVYFWLTDDARASSRAGFESALAELLAIDGIASGAYGAPAPTEARPVTDHSFDYALVLQFASKADHDAYQVDPAHDRFVERWKSSWKQVRVYDTETAVP